MKRYKLQLWFRNQWRDVSTTAGKPFYFTERDEAEKMLRIVTRGPGRVVEV